MKKILLNLFFGFFSLFILLTGEASAGLCATNANCNSGDFCYLFSCTSKRGNGSSCSANYYCQSDLCSGGTCQARGDAGDSCSGIGQGTCKSNLVCDGSTRECAHTPRQEGEGCGAVDWCADGLWCDGGRCARQGQAGDSCSLLSAYTCASGLVCDGSTLKCAHTPREEGEGCGAADWCASGLWCDSGYCAKQGQAGDSCNLLSAYSCAEGLECDGSTSKCAHTPRQEGEGCGVADWCADGLWCNAGECAKQGQAGDSCSLLSAYSCAEGLECDGSTSKCANTPREEGQGCGFADPCNLLTLYCSDPAAGTCYARKSAGEDCSLLVPNMCAEDLECDGSTSKCANVPREEGQGCGLADPCASEYFCTSPIAGICKEKYGAGQQCAESWECKDGLDCRLSSDMVSRCYPQEGHEKFDRETCLAYRNPGVAEDVKASGSAQTYGYGSAAAVGIGASDQVGVIYGSDGRFGCFLSTCIGGESNAGIKDYAAMGVYDSYDAARGSATAIVEEAGEIITFSTSQVLDQSGTYIGAENAVSVGVSVLPISAGVYVCNTVVDTFLAEEDGTLYEVAPLNADGTPPWEMDEATLAFNLKFNEPPVAVCNDVDICYEPSAGPQPADIDGGSYDPNGDAFTLVQTPQGPFDFGSHEVSLEITDAKGAVDSCFAMVSIRDCVPPTIESVTSSQQMLWPVNDKMVRVEITAIATDELDDDVSCRIQNAIIQEQDNHGSNLGEVSTDTKVISDSEIDLRAKRAGNGDGRTYLITVECSDDAGNTAQETVGVAVPHDRGQSR